MDQQVQRPEGVRTAGILGLAWTHRGREGEREVGDTARYVLVR